MNPTYNMRDAAQGACALLNNGIDQLKASDLEQGRKTLQIVIRSIRAMNDYYDSNHQPMVHPDGTKSFNNTSAAYNYSWNNRNIKKLEECVRLLDESNRNVPLVIEVLMGKKELTESPKI